MMRNWKSTPRLRRAGFTLIELLVVLSIISLLVAMLLPALSSAREAGRRSLCLANLRQIVQAANMYANDFRSWIPYGVGYVSYGISSEAYSSGTFGLLIPRYLPAPRSPRLPGPLICPSQKNEAWINETPWAWTSGSNTARWRGTYSNAYRSFHPNGRKTIVNPANHLSATLGPPAAYNLLPGYSDALHCYWPQLGPDDGTFVFAFDIVINSGGRPARATAHQTGYCAAYIDGSTRFFAGPRAERIDYWATVYIASYYNVTHIATFQFDLERGLRSRYPTTYTGWE